MYRFWIKENGRVVLTGASPSVKQINIIHRACYRSWPACIYDLEYELITDDDVMNVGLEELIG